MALKDLLSTVIKRDGFENIVTNMLESLDDLPSLQRKVEAFFLGAEFLLHIQGDNDAADVLAGRVVVSEATLTHFVNRMLEGAPDIECISVRVRDGYMLCKLGLDRGPGGLQVSVKIGNTRVHFDHEPPLILVDLLEFPHVRPGIPLAAFFVSLSTYFVKKMGGSERIFRRASKDIPGVSVQGNTFTVNLFEVPGVEDVLAREFLGIKLMETFSVDRVLLINGEVQIYGGPRIPRKLIDK
ncbi:MAG: hypothetical protein FH756_14960 [Firmicutes bacterium]|nr:hypothetical protein [Bacillota bacterium]